MIDDPVFFHSWYFFFFFLARAGTVACPELVDPQNGLITITVTTPGSTVSYSCRPGYVLDGPATRTCSDDGSWTGPDPLCNRMYIYMVHITSLIFFLLSNAAVDCGMLVAPSNGSVMMSPPDTTTLNSITTYFCNDGFQVSLGQSVRVCQQNGLWSGTAPSCVCKLIASSDPTDQSEHYFWRQTLHLQHCIIFNVAFHMQEHVDLDRAVLTSCSFFFLSSSGGLWFSWQSN